MMVIIIVQRSVPKAAEQKSFVQRSSGVLNHGIDNIVDIVLNIISRLLRPREHQ